MVFPYLSTSAAGTWENLFAMIEKTAPGAARCVAPHAQALRDTPFAALETIGASATRLDTTTIVYVCVCVWVYLLSLQKS